MVCPVQLRLIAGIGAIVTDYKISRHSIQIVDDDSDILFFLQSVLSEYTNVSLFESPTTALESFKKNSYDLVITDLQMPGMDGFELTKAIREIDKNVKIIIISGIYGGEKIDEFIARYGVSSFLEKPFDRTDLLKAMEEHEESI